MEEQIPALANTEQQDLSRTLQLCLASLLFLAELRRAALALAAQAEDVLWASAFDGLAVAADRLHAMRLRSDFSLQPAEEEQLPPALQSVLKVLAAEGATEVLAQEFLRDWMAMPDAPSSEDGGQGPSPILKALKTLHNDRLLDEWRTEQERNVNHEPGV